jgi:nicotinate-nucleotide adenylyltransferase
LCTGRDYMDIDDCELKRGGISYTVETLEYFAGKYGAKPAFVLGDDLLEGFGRWRKPDMIAEKSELLVAHRAYREKRPFGYPHRYLDNPILDISSSDIRQRIKDRRPVSYLVDQTVEEYIIENGLYI